MAISIADSPGCFPAPPIPFPSMPDNKATPIKHSVWHRLWLPRWLVGDGRRSASPSRVKLREWKLNRESYHGSTDNSTTGNDSTSFSQSLFAATGNLLPNSQHADRYGGSNRRAVSADRRTTTREIYGSRSLGRVSTSQLSAPEAQWDDTGTTNSGQFLNGYRIRQSEDRDDSGTYAETASVNGEDYRENLETELDKKWILNLSLRFRNGSDREKFFITYAETPNRWRRVTVSCDYGRAEPGSLEQDLKELHYQSDKNARIYESIRESISEIQFFETVTNLRLETIDGQLHVNVTEDAGEIIPYPSISTVRPLNMKCVPESELFFESHFSGFAYQVKHNGQDFVKKEIPGPDSVDEFLYEINALYELLETQNVIQLRAIVVDDSGQLVKGLLLDFAEKGDLAGLLQDFGGRLSWEQRERWARQIVSGLAEIHECGFVQGDLTLTNIVVDDCDDAKIIDINRRGCPIGWEPPEFKQKLENKQRISMYIGVKSDLFQLGMVLWALALQVDQPERRLRPLVIPSDMGIPEYYRRLVETCLSPKPKDRLSAKELLLTFPEIPENSIPEIPVYTQEEEPILGPIIDAPLPNGHVSQDQIPRSLFVLHTDNLTIVDDIGCPPNIHYSHTSLQPPYNSTAGLGTGTLNFPDNNDWLGGRGRIASPPTISAPYGSQPGAEDLGIAVDSLPVAHSDVMSGPASLASAGALGSPELDLDAPVVEIPFGGEPLTSGPDMSLDQALVPEELCCIGSHPTIFIDTQYVKARGVEDDYLGDQNRTLNSPPYVLETAAGTTPNISALEATKIIPNYEANSVPNQGDLFSSSLPINPTFAPAKTLKIERQSGSAQPNSGRTSRQADDRPRSSVIPQLRRVTSMEHLNDLFTSHLPINPRLDEKETHTQNCILQNSDPPFGNPSPSLAEPCPTNVYTSTPEIPPHDTNPPEAEAQAKAEAEADANCLFASALPINPAMALVATIDVACSYFADKVASVSLAERDRNPFELMSPIQPTVTEEMVHKASEHLTDILTAVETSPPLPMTPPPEKFQTVESVVNLSSLLESELPINPQVVEPTDLLLYSKLPINPAFVDREVETALRLPYHQT